VNIYNSLIRLSLGSDVRLGPAARGRLLRRGLGPLVRLGYPRRAGQAGAAALPRRRPRPGPQTGRRAAAARGGPAVGRRAGEAPGAR
jgi:hypothetical protein